jgi:ABC-type uncharacterized transport system permease subunit
MEANSMQSRPSYRRVFLTFARNSLIREMTFRANFLLQCVSATSWTLMNIGFYIIVFQHTDAIGKTTGWEQSEFFLFLGTTWLINSLVQTFFMPNAQEFSELIRTGNLDFALVKPIDTQFLISFQRVEWSSLSNFVLGVVLLIVSVVQLTTRGQAIVVNGDESRFANEQTISIVDSNGTASVLEFNDGRSVAGHHPIVIGEGKRTAEQMASAISEAINTLPGAMLTANPDENRVVLEQEVQIKLGASVTALANRRWDLEPLMFVLYPFYVLCGTAILYSVMIGLAATSIWLGRNQSLYNFWFYITNFSRYPMEIYQRSWGWILWGVFTFVVPVLVVVNVPARLLAQPLNPRHNWEWWLTGFALMATAFSLLLSRKVFQKALLSYRSASS